LYDGHPDLLRELKIAIAKQRHVSTQTVRDAKRYGIEADLAACRAERQRLISKNAALLLRAVTAEEALARIRRRAPGSAQDECSTDRVPSREGLPKNQGY
jgi:hypothetical protein